MILIIFERLIKFNNILRMDMNFRPHMQNQKLGNYSENELKSLKAKGAQLLAKIEKQ